MIIQKGNYESYKMSIVEQSGLESLLVEMRYPNACHAGPRSGISRETGKDSG